MRKNRKVSRKNRKYLNGKGCNKKGEIRKNEKEKK